MTAPFSIDIEVPLDRLTIALRWQTAEGSLGLFGHSGAGKTTVLEALAGLRRGVRGTIRIAGRTWLDTGEGVRMPPELRGVGYVPQDTLLFPHRDVLGNLTAGSRRAARRGGAAPAPDRVVELLELGPLRHRGVADLSGGERQRVALGRALCSGPDLLLLDEPLASLDAPLKLRILPFLIRAREELGVPALTVSHDATEISLLSREVCVLEAGRAVAIGEPMDVLTSERVLPMARQEGFENVLRGSVVETREGTATLALEGGQRITVPGAGLHPGAVTTVGVRAEDLILATRPPEGLSAQNRLAVMIREVRETPGALAGELQVVVLADLSGRPSPLAVAITRRAAVQLGLKPGSEAHVVFKTQACRVLLAG